MQKITNELRHKYGQSHKCFNLKVYIKHFSFYFLIVTGYYKRYLGQV